MKRHQVLALVTVVSLVLIWSPGALAGQPVVLKLGNIYPVEQPCNAAAKKMAEVVAAKTNGQLRIDLYPNGQLGSNKDNIEGTIMGTQDMVMENVGGLSQYSPRVGIGEAPYIWRNVEHMRKVIDGPLGSELKDEMLKGRGLRILTSFYAGTRQLTANKAIRTPEDLKGFKLRVPTVKVYMEMANAWGTVATPIAFGELYLALATGVVDGQENPLSTINSAKLFQAQKFLMLTGHIIAPMFVVINEGTWRRLSPEFQGVMMAAAAEGRAVNDALITSEEETLLKRFKDLGITVIQPDVEAFRKVSAPVAGKFEDAWGKGTYEKMTSAQ